MGYHVSSLAGLRNILILRTGKFQIHVGIRGV